MAANKHPTASASDQYSSSAVIGPCLYCGAPAGRLTLRIGAEPPSPALIRALGEVRAAAALANRDCGALDQARSEALARAALQVSVQPPDAWGRSLWQDGGGAGLAYPLDLAILEVAREHADFGPDDVRRHQCVEAVQTALHIAALRLWETGLSPALAHLTGLLEQKAAAWSGLIKIGRTHLQDAAPLTLGQEVSGWLQQVRNGRTRLSAAAEDLLAVPFGRGCLGTGAGVPAGFAASAVRRLAELTGLALRPSSDALADLTGPGRIAFFHAALATLAAALFKIASDVRLLASGPAAGFNELRLPETGLPCSSLPGKTNPDAAEALAQVCVQVIGADGAVALAASQGQFESNGFLPLLAYNVLRSATLLSGAIRLFTDQGVAGLEPRKDVLARNVAQSVMLVTALAPHIGYDAAAKIARDAYQRKVSLREAALASGEVDAETYERLVRPERMLGPNGG